MLSAVETTERGFEIVEFTDRYGAECSLQQSSLANEPAIWLGCTKADPKVLVHGEGWQPVSMPENYIANTRMHLTVPMVEGLIEHLQSWLETGSF